jgi:SAM-dependent methyltransferase
VTTSLHIVTQRRRTPEPQDGIDSANRRTIDSYERIAREYADDTAPDSSGAAGFSGEGLRRLVDAVPAGGTALEVGSGPGWDADFLESQGVAVRRTDVAAAFIDIQAERGKHVEKLDVTQDELGGPYDAAIALAVLQHVDRALIPALLRRVAAALKPGGVFLVAIPEGDGERWEVGDSGNAYFVVLWGESAFRTLLGDAGFGVEWSFSDGDSEESRWVMFLARKES